MRRKALLTTALAAALALTAFGGPTLARQSQSAAQAEGIEWDKRRLDRLERNLRRLERAVGQHNEAGQPVLLQPDPETVALQGAVEVLNRRVEDLEATLQRVNGQLEQANLDAGRARRDLAAARDQNEVLFNRLSALEARVGDLQQAQAAVPPPPADPAQEFDAAMRLMRAGEFSNAGRAFETFVQTFPDSERTPEAWFRLGETRFIADDHGGAAAAYATSLKGWPRSNWAPEANAKLAASLATINRNRDACAALVEFDRRYAATASAAIKQRVAATKTRAKCA